jgi:hypothetical protein
MRTDAPYNYSIELIMRPAWASALGVEMGKITSGAPRACRLAPFRQPEVAATSFRRNEAIHGPRRRSTAHSVTGTVSRWACGDSQAQLRFLVAITTLRTRRVEPHRRLCCRPARHRIRETN